MTEKHINETELLHKIEKLMQYRLFPELFDESSKSQRFKSQFYQLLIDLQKSIYFLDAHLEAHWKTDEHTLSLHWQNISSKLMDFEISPENQGEYLNHIRKYAKHELELRVGKTPLRFDMEYFYFYKSCDVKLLRRLIYEKLDLALSVGQLSDWRYYDLITEVNDDIEDLAEDLNFINGNRFLISLLQKGRSATKSEFLLFMDEIGTKSKQKYQTTKGKFCKQIFNETNLRIEETKRLMDKVLSEVDDKSLFQSVLFTHQTALQL